MNFELHVIGSRYGYENYPHDGLDEELRECAALRNKCATLVISRSIGISHYVYLQSVGKKDSNDFVGLSLSFNGVYFRTTKTALEVLERLFETSMYSGLIIHIADNGEIEFNPQSFYEQRVNYNKLKEESQRIVDSLPRNSLTYIPHSFLIGQGNVSVNVEDGEIAIASMIAQYDRVAVSMGVKHFGYSGIQDRLSMLYTKSVEFEKKYNAERKKKKQYSLVVFLSLILLGCVTGFWLLNDVLNDKNVKINELEENVKNQSAMITTLNEEKQTLNDLIIILNNEVRTKEDSVQILQDDISTLQSIVNSLEYENGELKTDIGLARNQLQDNQKTIQNLRKTSSGNSGERYKVWSSSGNQACIYYQYGDNYSKTSYYVNDNTVITVWHIQNGYAMTSVGYLRTVDIKKL